MIEELGSMCDYIRDLVSKRELSPYLPLWDLNRYFLKLKDQEITMLFLY